MVLGNHRLISGKADIAARNNISNTRKGATPFKIIVVGILKIVFTAKRSVPIGGDRCSDIELMS
jgi:hypothetical protein